MRGRDVRPVARALAVGLGLAQGACATRTPDEPGHATTAPSPLPRVRDAAPAQPAARPDASTSASATVEPRAPAIPRLVELGVRVTQVHKARRLSWRQVQTVNWQAVAEGLPELPPLGGDLAVATTPGDCPRDMLAIEGGLLLDARGRADTDGVQDLQDSVCEAWRVPKRICERFSKERWSAVAASLPRKPLRFCVDRYEYPNRRGEFPLVVTTFSESAKYCAREGKRLCTESEWTLACEGEEGRPYPYGYARDATACPLDRPRVEPPEDTFIPRTNAHTARGIDAMWHGERSGAFARCVSPYGVADMTGNVDEWTLSDRRWGYRMILKGGHWSFVRGRCRPQTRGHGPLYVNVETGFRCCQDAAPRAP